MLVRGPATLPGAIGEEVGGVGEQGLAGLREEVDDDGELGVRMMMANFAVV